jgi:hypothetical protein
LPIPLLEKTPVIYLADQELNHEIYLPEPYTELYLKLIPGFGSRLQRASSSNRNSSRGSGDKHNGNKQKQRSR